MAVFGRTREFSLKNRTFVSRNKSNTVLGCSNLRPTRYKNWDEGKLEKACQAVSRGMSIRRAAEEHEVPRSTLHDHVTGKVQPGAKSGPRRYLNSTEELDLMHFLTGVASLGYFRTTKQIIQIVQEVVIKKGMDVTVSPSWWRSFHQCHKELTLRDLEVLSHVRIAGADNSMLEKYFDLLETTLSESELNDQPCLIFNLDESGFLLSPKLLKIATQKGEKHPACITSNEKTQNTVLACVSAGGYALPPLVIFDRKTRRPVERYKVQCTD